MSCGDFGKREREIEEWFDGVESSNHTIKLSLLRSLYDWCVMCALSRIPTLDFLDFLEHLII